jgi:alkaline phosphatase
MKNGQKYLIALFLILAVTCHSISPSMVLAKDNSSKWSPNARNVIFFVGDGMGPDHRELIRLMSVGPRGQIAMNDMPYSGLSITNSTSTVTDSAAGATAFASGVKTYNGAIGVNENKQPVETVLELAKKAGKSTGIVTTSQVTDATGGAFGAHVEDRKQQTEIARQFLEKNKVDVILGGGRAHFKNEQINLVGLAQRQGYQFATNTQELKGSSGSQILGLFAEEEMFEKGPEGEGVYKPSVSLPDMTTKAINTLSQNRKGFFLVVEEEGIDEMAHENNAELVIKAGKQLNRSVEIAKDFAKSNPNTLIIVAADHETGGMAIEAVDEEDESGDISPEDGPFKAPNSDQQFIIDWTTKEHSGVFVPVTAMGPGAENLTGVFQNTHIHDVMVDAMGLQD